MMLLRNVLKPMMCDLDVFHPQRIACHAIKNHRTLSLSVILDVQVIMVRAESSKAYYMEELVTFIYLVQSLQKMAKGCLAAALANRDVTKGTTELVSILSFGHLR